MRSNEGNAMTRRLPLILSELLSELFPFLLFFYYNSGFLQVWSIKYISHVALM